MMKADVDDAGHLITARENIYGAGFMVYYYSEEDNEHHLLLDYTMMMDVRKIWDMK